jgi:hypothetical protein
VISPGKPRLLSPGSSDVNVVDYNLGTEAGNAMSIMVGSIVIRCYEFEKMVAFWQEALHYVAKEPPKGGWVILRDPEGKGPNVSLDQHPEKRSGKRGRLHLDLYATDQEAEVERLVRIGATRYPWRYEPGADFVVLEDPDGNLFCVVHAPIET